MKNGLLTALSLLAMSSPAFAYYREPITVDRMTCARAQAFASKYKRYYKNGGPDGAIPIYPVTGIHEISCGRKNFTAVQWERTLDNPQCVLGYYCQSF